MTTDIRLEADTVQVIGARVAMRHADRPPTVEIDVADANLVLGGRGSAGEVTCITSDGEETVRANGAQATVTVGGGGVDGRVFVASGDELPTIEIDGATATMAIGLSTSVGALRVRSADGEDVLISGSDASVTCRRVQVITANGVVDLFDLVMKLDQVILELKERLANLEDTVDLHHP